ncbi:NDP-sugar synthase [Candidatus Peregrinibacteria bacterium]|nr:NDP-sugar synthase [Candidatus Peregrinibacteria bacterium]
MQAFILAGGFATRLWPLTEKRAKPLLPLAGVPLIEYLVRDIPAGIPITVSTNAMFHDAFTAWKETLNRRDISILIEETRSDDEKLGALGATAQWIDHHDINEDVLLLTGDNYCGFSMKQFLDARTPGETLIAVHDIKDLEKAKAFGTVITPSLAPTSNAPLPITSFEEKPVHPKTSLVSTGCAVLPASVLPIVIEYAAIKPDNVGGIFEELLARGLPVHAFTFSEPWFDVGSFEAYLEATRSLVGERFIEEESAEIEQTSCEGSVVVGKRSSVKRSVLKDTVLFEDCVVENCTLRNCILDKGCVLKGVDLNGKMLREKTRLAL